MIGYLVSSLSPSPTPSSVRLLLPGASNGELTIAILGAIVGAVLALLGEIGLRAWRDRSRNRLLVGNLVHELEEIVKECTSRSEIGETLHLPRPLPTAAWNAVQHLPRLTQLLRRSPELPRVYQQVETVNHQGKHVGLFLVGAALAHKQFSSEALAMEARRLATELTSQLSTEAETVIKKLRPRHGTQR